MKNRKIKKTDVLRKYWYTVREIRGVSPDEVKKGYSRKDLQKRKLFKPSQAAQMDRRIAALVELESIDLRPEAAILRVNVYQTFTSFV